jgi:hypothetical protein
MYLLNKKAYAGEHRNSLALNLLGAAVIVVTALLAARFILAQAGLA